MTGKYKISAIICALALAVTSFGAYMDNAGAASLPVTSDGAVPVQKMMEWGNAKSTDINTDVQQLLSGKKVQGRLVSGDDGQQYQITLKSSGQLDINLEGDTAKLSGHLTDRKGKSWDPRKAVGGKHTYQLNKGIYYYQLQAAKGTEIPETGLDYAVTATFRSAEAKYENNTTRKKAAKLPFDKVFYGHLASNASTEYYKFTLDRQSYFSFSLTTQITDDTPETFVVTLYNKQGQPMSSWGNPDWVEYFKDSSFVNGYNFEFGMWYYDDEFYSYDVGAAWVLPADDYYIGVSVERDKNGKVPASARYGQYAAFAAFWSPSVSVELSHKQAEYTGKTIKPPKVIIRKRNVNWLRRSYESSRYLIDGITVGTGRRLRKIGRYKIQQNIWEVDREVCSDDTKSYVIFTVTPIRGKISRVSSKNPGEIKVSVKKNAQSTGYQIQIARDKKFKKSVRNLKTTNLKEIIKGLSAGKKYYIRVRNYKDVKTSYGLNYLESSSGDTPWDMLDIPVWESIYGKWSKTRTIVCK